MWSPVDDFLIPLSFRVYCGYSFICIDICVSIYIYINGFVLSVF